MQAAPTVATLMSSRVDPAKTAAETREPREPRERDRGKKRSAAPAPSGRGGRFDKAFPVWLEGDRGVASGIARHATGGGMFVERRGPFPLPSRARGPFVSPARAGTEMTLEAEVRYQCFINFAKAG